MTPLGLTIIIASLLLFIRALRRDFLSGLAFAVAVFVIVPHELTIVVPGIPDLTLHRLFLLCLFPFIPRLIRESAGWRRIPFFRSLMALAGAQLLSLAFSEQPLASLKYFLSFTFEVLIFYVILSLSIRSEEDAMKLLKAAAYGLGVVAFLATIQKYTGFDVFVRLTGSLRTQSDLGVNATYAHRILLGYAMAMAISLVFVLLKDAEGSKQRFRLWALLLLSIGACYFSTSRGPWLGIIFGMAVLTLMRCVSLKTIAVISGLTMLVLIARPGVWQTISGLSKETFEQDTLKGRSYSYRWRLWYVAYAEITKDPIRLLFGYGGESTESMDLSGYFERESGGTTILLGFTSWDNNFACNLIEFGVIGFGCEVLIYCAVLKQLLLGWRRSEGRYRYILAASTAVAAIYLFAMTNVYIFSPQLKYLFWTVVAIGASVPQLQGVVTEDRRSSLLSGKTQNEGILCEA